MILNKENLDFKYWINHLPFDFEITPWERKIIREYFVVDLNMPHEYQIDWDCNQIKFIVDLSRFFYYNLS